MAKTRSTPGTFSARVTTEATLPDTVEDHELRFARRALAKMKMLLGPEGVKQLLKDEVRMSDELWHRYVNANTSGVFRPARVLMSIDGVDVSDFLSCFKETALPSFPLMVGAEPEHFVMEQAADGRTRVIENLGDHITLSYVQFEPPTESWQHADVDLDYRVRMSGHASLEDGTVVGYILHQFRQRPSGGFDMDLCIYFPASCPETLFEQPRQHLTVEFTNWTRACFDHQKLSKVDGKIE